MFRIRVVAAGLLVVSMTACSNNPDVETHAFEARLEDGVVVAESRGGPKYDGELFAYEPILQIRGDERNPESLLYRPSGVVRIPDGSYVVADAGNYRMAVYDSLGRFLRSFGREGEGPGEFKWIAELRTFAGQLIVRDAMLRRTYAFRSDGLLLSSVTNPLPFFSRIPTLWGAPDGRMVAATTIEERAGIHSGIHQNAAVVLSAPGDTLAVVFGPRLQSSHRYPVGAGTLSAPVYYSGASLCRYFHGKGIVITGGEEPVVEWYSLEGRLARRILVDMPKEPVSGEDRRRIREFLDRQVADSRPGAREGSGRLRPEMAEGLRDHAEFAEFKAYWDMISVDMEGFMWLQVPYEDGSLVPRPAREMQRLLSPEGEYMGTTQWPAVDRVTWIGEGLLLAIVVEEDTGLQVPTVFRIRPVAEGLDYPGGRR